MNYNNVLDISILVGVIASIYSSYQISVLLYMMYKAKTNTLYMMVFWLCVLCIIFMTGLGWLFMLFNTIIDMQAFQVAAVFMVLALGIVSKLEQIRQRHQ